MFLFKTGIADMESALPWNQVLAFQHFKKFHGYMGDMFALNPSLDNFFTELQASMDYHPQHESLNFNNILKLEIADVRWGIQILNHSSENLTRIKL